VQAGMYNESARDEHRARVCIEEGSPDVAQDERRAADNDGKRAQIPEAERRERLTLLVLYRTKLSASEALLLREVFPEILASHHDQVWDWLRKRGLSGHEAEDLLLEAFFALHNHILEHGFPDNLPGMLRMLTEGKLLNHLRATRRAPVSLGLPSSSSEKLTSELDVERALGLQELAWYLVDQLSLEHQGVIDKVVLNGLSFRDAAAVLDLPEGTVKSRLIAAKGELLALAERLLPPSQRGPT
jgi:DNA-directed RNA polymerase specialized sigma24 family protein